MQRPNYENLLDNLKTDEQADFKFQERRHSQWTENYQLYRDTVITNRLTQRQSVNMPLMKTSIKTNLATLDEFPRIEYEELGNDKQKEIFLNTYWDDTVIKDRMEIKDIVDKKQEQLYGLTWRKLNIIQGKFCSEVKEPFDMLKDRYADPTDYDNTAHHLIEGNIFRTLDQLEANPFYNRDAIKRLKVFFGTQNGLIKAEEVTKMMQAKNERLGQMGVGDIDNPALGHTVVELKAYFVKEWDLKDQESHLHLIVAADCGITGKEILMAKPLKEILNIDFFPFVFWSSDPERNDHYPDGTADIIRTPNKVLNIWFSQLIENRTLRNFGMNFYDATAKEGWSPQTLEPMPFGWYGLPGKPSDVFQAVQIPDLSESLDEMDYVKNLIESASAATATTKGETEKSKVTLGEVELALQAAKERQSSVAKFYTLAQKEFGDKFAKIANANSDKLEAVKLYKKSYKGNWFEKTVSPTDWRSEAGYSCRVVSSTEREQKTLETVQKMNAVKAQFPVNQALKRIYDKKVMEFGGLNPEEIQEVMDEEVQNPMPMMMPMQGQPQLTPQPNVPVPVA
jgi:hypothetical protein